MALPRPPLLFVLFAALALVQLAVVATAHAAATTIDLPAPAAGTATGSEQLVVRLQPGVRLEGAEPLSPDGTTVAVHTTDRGAAALASDPRVASVEDDVLMHWTNAVATLNSVTNDPLIGDQWMLGAIGWFRSPLMPATPTIAFLDSGLDTTHPDLAGTLPDGRPKIAATWSTVTDDPSVTDDFGHGTATSSVATALTNNGEGLASIAPGSQVIMVKVGGTWGVRLSDAVEGVIWAAAHGAKVINVSFASPDPSPAMHAAIADAVSKGVTVVAAVGNEGCAAEGGSNQLQYPAAYAHVIGVSSTDASGRVSCFSNYGKEVDIAAPGDEVYMAVPKGIREGTLLAERGYRTASGTSFAAPVVSAAVALLAYKHPDWTPGQLAAAIARSAKDIDAPGRDLRSGAGLLDLSTTLANDVPPALDFQEVNDDVREARRYPALITPLRRKRVITASLAGANDPSDVYRVDLRRRSKLRVHLVGAQRGSVFHVRLWHGRTRTVAKHTVRRVAAQSRNRPRRSTLVATIAKRGTYWVQVTQVRRGGRYSLSVNAR